MLLPGIGEPGQRRLRESRAVIVGCGALGCSIADLLARAGVGRLTIIDRDVVELTNLQRQTLFSQADAEEGVPKAEAARRRIAAVNPEVSVEAVVADVVPRNVERLVGLVGGGKGAAGAVVLDGTDNFETRYLINDLAVKHGLSYIYGGAVGTRGMAMAVLPGRTPCLRCVFDEPPAPGISETCDTAGVLGPVIAAVAAVQAAEAVKILSGNAAAVSPGVVEIDLWTGRLRRLDVGGPRAECSACGLRRFEYLNGRGGDAVMLCGQGAVQVSPALAQGVDLEALAARLAVHGTFSRMGRFLVRGTLAPDGVGLSGAASPISITVFADGRAIIKGTDRPEVARSIYARYIGT